MKLSKKQPNRELRVSRYNDDFVLIERTRYVPPGFTKGKWEEERVLITASELSKLVEFAKKTAPV